MGKLRRQRQKLHISKKEPIQNKDDITVASTTENTQPLPLSQPNKDLFAGLNINFGNIKTNLSDDVRSVKSLKSLKNEGSNALSKKQKLKLRRELLLKKIDSVNQLKKEIKLRKKRKNTAIIGDTNPLYDALPSLESLLKNRTDIKYNKTPQKMKKKAVEKASTRKKKLTRDVFVFKQTLKNKKFLNNPFEAISSHIKNVVQKELKVVKI